MKKIVLVAAMGVLTCTARAAVQSEAGGSGAELQTGMRRFDVAGKMLQVELSGAYPDGYSPSWDIVSKVPQIVAANAVHRILSGSRTENIKMAITEDEGRPALLFNAGKACVAHLSGVPQVITSSYKKFQLSDFHLVGQSGAACSHKGASNWKGWVGLSINSSGDLTIDASLDSADARGAYSSYTVSRITYPNKMSAERAVLDSEEKADAAAAKREADVAAAEVAAKQRKERDAKRKEADELLKSIENSK